MTAGAHEVERVGVLGGTFDPVHVGHLVAAAEVRWRCDLDRVLLVVAGDPWQKRGDVVATAEDRYAMVAAAVEGVDGIAASRLELDRFGPTYTVDTVGELRAPGRELFLIVGDDVAARLGTWERVDDLRRMVTLVVVTRPGSAPAHPPGWHALSIPIPRLDVSSTEIRARLATGAPVEFLVPAAALRVLRERRLYAPA